MTLRYVLTDANPCIQVRDKKHFRLAASYEDLPMIST